MSETTDYYVIKASEHFNIPVESVTKEQRKLAKQLYWGDAYKFDPSKLAQTTEEGKTP